MQKYVANNALMSTQGQAGRIRVQEYFSMPNMVQQYERVYDELLELEKLAAAWVDLFGIDLFTMKFKQYLLA